MILAFYVCFVSFVFVMLLLLLFLLLIYGFTQNYRITELQSVTGSPASEKVKDVNPPYI